MYMHYTKYFLECQVKNLIFLDFLLTNKNFLIYLIIYIHYTKYFLEYQVKNLIFLDFLLNSWFNSYIINYYF